MLPNVQYTPIYIKDDSSAPAPGTLLKHYAPQAELTVFDGPRNTVLDNIRQTTQWHLNQNKHVGLLLTDRDVSQFEDLDVYIATLGDSDTATAARLYAALRELDTQKVDIILARAPQAEGIGLAVRDRMTRAAEGRIIQIK
jgi:L-threonylcarbamoyladenylate synthase